MNAESRAHILTEAIKKYGHDNQIRMAIEEMSELTKELCKLYRSSSYEQEETCIKHIREEMVDAQIMLDQLKFIFGWDSDIEEYKLNRLEERMHDVYES